MKPVAPIVLFGNESECLGQSEKYPLVSIFKKGLMGKDQCFNCGKESTFEVGLGKFGQVCCQDHIEEAAEYVWAIICAMAKANGYCTTKEEIIEFCRADMQNIKPDANTRVYR